MTEKYISIDFELEGKTKTITFTKVLADDIKQLIYEMIKYEQDILLVFDGKEGSGKSHTLRQIGWLCNHYLMTIFNICNSFDIDNIHYHTQDYIKTSYANKDKIGWINALDEGGDEIDKGAVLSAASKRFIRYLRKCRKLQQIHLVAMPSAHDLTKYVALWRQKFIIKMEVQRVISEKSPTGKDLVLGNFRIIRNDARWQYCYMDKTPYKYPIFLSQNKYMQLHGKKEQRVKYMKDHKGKFLFCEVFSQKQLKDLKAKNLELAELADTAESGDDKTNTAKDAIVRAITKFPNMPLKDIAEIVGCSLRYVQDISKRTREA